MLVSWPEMVILPMAVACNSSCAAGLPMETVSDVRLVSSASVIVAPCDVRRRIDDAGRKANAGPSVGVGARGSAVGIDHRRLLGHAGNRHVVSAGPAVVADLVGQTLDADEVLIGREVGRVAERRGNVEIRRILDDRVRRTHGRRKAGRQHGRQRAAQRDRAVDADRAVGDRRGRDIVEAEPERGVRRQRSTSPLSPPMTKPAICFRSIELSGPVKSADGLKRLSVSVVNVALLVGVLKVQVLALPRSSIMPSTNSGDKLSLSGLTTTWIDVRPDKSTGSRIRSGCVTADRRNRRYWDLYGQWCRRRRLTPVPSVSRCRPITRLTGCRIGRPSFNMPGVPRNVPPQVSVSYGGPVVAGGTGVGRSAAVGINPSRDRHCRRRRAARC